MRRLSLTARVLLLCLAVTGCGGSPPEPDKPERRRLAGAAKGWNVVLLTVDTLRADRLGAYGYTVRPTSPRLDAELGAGVVFEQAMAPRAATWPSLASLLSGLYPRTHGVTENGYSFPDDLETLPKRLRQAGYRTGAFLSNMCKANHQGWDDLACTGGEDGKTIQRALEWAKAEEQAGRPYFLWVHLFGAHGPYYNGGDRAARELDPGYAGPVGPKRWQLDRIMTEKVALGPRDVQHLDALYDAAVMGTDGLSAALLDGLKAAGRMENTVLVFAADHGEELYDHQGYLYHACSVYQTTLHVPLALQAPGLLPAGARVPQTVELIDVAPTLLELLGLPALPMQHGRSLIPYLERPGEGGPGKPAFSEYGSTNIGTVLQGDWKLIQNPDGFVPVCIPGAPPGHYPIGKVELYNLAEDPLETTDLAAREPGRVAELSQVLRQRLSSLPRRSTGQEVPEELREELKALGYVAP